MVLSRNWKKRITFAALTVALGFCGRGNAARAEAPGQQYPAQNNSAPAATLQVTGTANRFSVAANHADAQETLKTVFDQAGKQFVLENNVAGQITLRLTDQPLSVVLDAITRQAFLRYRTDANTGITTFERDDDALRVAFTRLRSLDASLRDQMRLLGLGLPSENALGFAQGGRGGAYGRADASAQNENNGQNGNDLRNSLDEAMRASRRGAIPAGPQSPAMKDAAGGGQSRVLEVAPPGPVGQAADADKTALDTNGVADIQQFLQANNFVSFHIPLDKPEPIYSILQSWAQQAKVPILIDPDVPNGSKFRLRGSISPRPLPEALNLLAPSARLEWRWVGNTIFIETAPDFALFFSDDKEPRVRYAAPPASRKTDAPAPQKPEEKTAPKSKP